MSNLPESLIEEIKQGNCVVFIGAGFSMPALPQWHELIARLSGHVPLSKRQDILELVKHLSESSSQTSGIFGYEMAAQLIKDSMPNESAFKEALEAELLPDKNHKKLLEHRLDLLSKVPFGAVLTTNFDGSIKGEVPGSKIYRQILRDAPRNWTRSHPAVKNAFIPTVKLHGSVVSSESEEIVFTSQDYRERLFSNVGYLNFLRSLMSTKTILFLGFSFSDPYLNLVRDEVMVQLGGSVTDIPAVYAVLPDISDSVVKHLREREGLHVISYDSDGGKRHDGFDEFLTLLVNRTDPLLLAPGLIQGKNILWMDPSAERNAFALKYLGEESVTITRSVDEAVSVINKRNPENTFNLMISRWGHGEGGYLNGAPISDGRNLMNRLKEHSIEIPVIFFASGAYFYENRREALTLGAYEYTCTFPGLLEEIEKIFSREIK